MAAPNLPQSKWLCDLHASPQNPLQGGWPTHNVQHKAWLGAIGHCDQCASALLPTCLKASGASIYMQVDSLDVKLETPAMDAHVANLLMAKLGGSLVRCELLEGSWCSRGKVDGLASLCDKWRASVAFASIQVALRCAGSTVTANQSRNASSVLPQVFGKALQDAMHWGKWQLHALSDDCACSAGSAQGSYDACGWRLEVITAAR